MAMDSQHEEDDGLTSTDAVPTTQVDAHGPKDNVVATKTDTIPKAPPKRGRPPKQANMSRDTKTKQKKHIPRHMNQICPSFHSDAW